ncbi:MAG TPA: nicotinate phosphoribosyltransferase [Verrucomicrobiae bacterium]|nr:nicotinate phosphoribosyltransferase [Verrucomicrobiae bacterium]
MNAATEIKLGNGRALLTDLYQLTMAYGYWKSGRAEREAVFHLFFRKAPFQSGFTLAAGLDLAIRFLQDFHFAEDDLQFLATLKGNDGQPLFEAGFLDYLRGLKFTCDVDAIPEGTVVFPHEPLLRIKGPILQCQLLETALLNLINFQSLIATKAARVCLAAKGEPVMEFGLRRAQGVDGALAASRAAYIGGCAATSNVLAGKLFGIPVRGTHAHSWVMSFDDEREAFQAYAEAMPNNCVFLVDTYDTLEGVRHAVETGKWLRERGHEMVGIRLDSGDLAWLSIEGRKILDAAGFPKAVIIASNDLDEHIITSLKDQGAQINVWGVGTKLITAYDQPALGGVYKLGAIRGDDGQWAYKVKLSEQAAKVSNPGIQQVRRFRSATEFIGDGIYDLEAGATENFVLVDPLDATRRKHLPPETAFEDLLVPVFRRGQPVYQTPPLTEVRERAQTQIGMFHAGIKRFVNPHQYPVGLELGLHEQKMKLILHARGEI